MANTRKKKNIWDVMSDKVDAAVLEAGMKESHVLYSAYESDDDDEPIDNLDTIAVKGKVRLVGFANEFYGGKKSKDYKSEILENPTWLQVCICTNAMIEATNDHHHVFLEGLDKLEKKYQIEKGVTIYEFCMGS